MASSAGTHPVASRDIGSGHTIALRRNPAGFLVSRAIVARIERQRHYGGQCFARGGSSWNGVEAEVGIEPA